MPMDLIGCHSMPGSLAGFHLVQDIVAQSARKVVVEVRHANVSGGERYPDAGESSASLKPGLCDRDALSFTEQERIDSVADQA